MRKGLKALACLLMGISIVAASVSPAQAQEKIDRKVEKDCEAVRNTYDYVSAGLITGMPYNPEATKEMVDVNATTQILIKNCEKLDAKTWKSIKQDHIKVIKKANLELKRIVKKYKLSKTIVLTCMKNGQIKTVESINPACPKGFKELYRK